jgi:hypothetical protein
LKIQSRIPLRFAWLPLAALALGSSSFGRGPGSSGIPVATLPVPGIQEMEQIEKSLLSAEVPATLPSTAPASLTAEQLQLVDTLQTLARINYASLVSQEYVVKMTPEFLQLELDVRRRMLYTQLLAYPKGPERKAALEAYVADCETMEKKVKARRDIDVGISSMAEALYALAEAKFLLSTDGHGAYLPLP